MNEETPDQPDTHELSLDQLRLLGDLLSCLDTAGYDPKDTQRLRLILAPHLRPQAEPSLPGPAGGDQALRPEPDDALLDTLDTATLIARSSLGTPSARRIRSLTSAAQIAEILRRRDQVTTAAQQPPAGLAETGVTKTVPTTALPAPASGRSAMAPQIMRELLASHAEAPRLLAEASHRRELARSSAASATRKFAAAQAARLGYEELRHRLNPRRRRTVHFGAGLAVLVVLIVGIFLGLLPAALDGFGLGLSWPAVWGHAHGNPVSGFLISVFTLMLAAIAAALISRTEPASLLVAKRRWRRARAAHEAAVQTKQADLAAASVATEAWLSLVRTQASSGPGSGARAVDETVALAAALLERRRATLLTRAQPAPQHSTVEADTPLASAQRSVATPFWDALDLTEREALRSVASWRTFAAGARIMEGDRADHVLVILGGQAKVCVAENGTERVLAVRGRGELVGERGALEVSVRSPTVIALDMVWALVVQTKDFAAFISAHPRVLGIVQDQVYQRGAEAPVGRADDRDRGGDPQGTLVTATGSQRDDGYLAGRARRLPRPLNGENCTVILSDVVGFGSRARTDEDRRVIRDSLFSMTYTALQNLPHVWSWDDRGDGLLTVVPPSVPTALVIRHLHKELPGALDEHNHAHPDPARIRLRVAINVGPVVTDAIGVSGEAIIVTARLVEAPDFKKALARSMASLGIIVSPFVYDTVIRHDADPRELASYSPVPVEVKESLTTAWMKLIDQGPTMHTEMERPGSAAAEPA